MKKAFLLSFIALLLGGCASPNVKLNQAFWQKPERVKVANDKIQHASMYQAGREGLLDFAINDIATSTFRKYLRNFDLKAISSTRNEFVHELNAHHVQASSYSTIDVSNLSRSHEDKKRFAARNFTQFKTKIGKDKLLVVSADQVGAVRQYYAFIPLDAPKAICTLEGRLISVKDNRILWRYTSKAVVPVDGKWDQPPNYPNFTHALNQAIAMSKSQLMDNFFAGTSTSS